MKTTLLCVLIAALGAACLQRADRAPPASDTSAVPNSTATPAGPAPAAAPTPPPPPAATKLAVVEGFLTPESVLHDPVQDIYFVSNINGSPTAKDNNGFISRVRPDGAVENLKFIEGGHSGVTLNAPKGLAIRDRKSTRLNSSHLVISYAVFCLKKKKNRITQSVMNRGREHGPWAS